MELCTSARTTNLCEQSKLLKKSNLEYKPGGVSLNNDLQFHVAIAMGSILGLLGATLEEQIPLNTAYAFDLE